MNSRVAVEIANEEVDRRMAKIMGWPDGRLRTWSRYGGLAYYKYWPVDNEMKRQTHAMFNPRVDLNHAKMAWDKLSDEQKDYVYEYMIDLAPHKRQEDNYLDAKVLCEAMLAAKGGG